MQQHRRHIVWAAACLFVLKPVAFELRDSREDRHREDVRVARRPAYPGQKQAGVPWLDVSRSSDSTRVFATWSVVIDSLNDSLNAERRSREFGCFGSA